LSTESGLGLDTFDERYIGEVVRQRSVVHWIPFVGAWAERTPKVVGLRDCPYK
jgi:hypothetical protein